LTGRRDRGSRFDLATAWISQAAAKTMANADHWTSRSERSASASSHSVGNPAITSSTSMVAAAKMPSRILKAVIFESMATSRP
jgi:hypothetical protein